MERSTNPKKQDSVVSIPQDLITEILARLPPKSIAKLIVVSKLWSSTIRSKYFTDLYLTRSLTRLCVLFTFHRDSTRFFHSVSEELPKSSSSTTTTSLPRNPLYDVSPPIRGLICCQDSSKIVISNPSTGQFVDLPKFKTRRKGISAFLGYDSIKDEYKVLSMTVSQRAHKYKPVVSEDHHVFTLGAQKNKKKEIWRRIECKHPHCPATKGLCNNGVVYYGAWSYSHTKGQGQGSIIVGFDVRMEEFSRIKLPDGVEIKPDHKSELVKYQKKIALVDEAVYQGNVELWILEDVEIQSWSKILVVVPGWAELVGNNIFYCRGAISSGVFIFTTTYCHPRPFYIISYDSKENIGTRVHEIGGIRNRFDSIRVFLDHVESPMFL
ncbi:F-box/kelch-repeat protein [Cardamine amara subsp. amara]|uniref:F-box/kelch-repeat protein n=1 Tax=Cardamine amara subsp. amara TaxID=228776 RepID=A0ABD1ATN7_CARAN